MPKYVQKTQYSFKIKYSAGKKKNEIIFQKQGLSMQYDNFMNLKNSQNVSRKGNVHLQQNNQNEKKNSQHCFSKTKTFPET